MSALAAFVIDSLALESLLKALLEESESMPFIKSVMLLAKNLAQGG
jgi:hypothetical protein